MAIDRFDWHMDSTVEAYWAEKGIASNDFPEEDEDLLWQRAGNHIGFFMTWVILRGFVGGILKDESEVLEMVRTGKMTGTDYMITYCDKKLYESDICDELQGFISRCYQSEYLKVYEDWVVNHKQRKFYTFVGTWEDFCEFRPALDKLYEEYLSGAYKKAGFFSRLFRWK